jgi:2-dehydropantoate 2-reductase
VKICILGAGSLGSAIGGVLAESGVDVTLLSRSAAHVDAIRRDGLRLVEDERDRTVRVRAAMTAKEIGPVDLVVVLVKAPETRQAIADAMPMIGTETIVVSLQNGLGHEEILSEMLGPQRVLAGRTYCGGVLLAPGRVRIGIRGKETIMGEVVGGRSARVEAVAATFARAGLRTIVRTDIMGAIWDKLLVNVATGALCGITGLPYGLLYRLPEIEACAVAAVREAMAVARAAGVTLTFHDPREAWLKAGAGLSGEFKTSMLQSLERGRMTEIDTINGAVVAQGRRYGVPTPVNETLVACIKGIERRIADGAAGT